MILQQSKKKALVFCIVFFMTQIGVFAQMRTGAWKFQNGSRVELAVLVDGYFSHTQYDVENKEFVSTRGGLVHGQGDEFQVEWQYDTKKTQSGEAPENWLGTKSSFYLRSTTNGYESNISSNKEMWQAVEQSSTELTGVWRMAGRKQGEQITTQSLGERRTLKILTGNRFQWVAIHIKTGAFSGTGGGTYTFTDGKYIENIEFFSRDATRVGASLAFDGKVVDGQWHHSGNSSKGEPIYEIWEKLGR